MSSSVRLPERHSRALVEAGTFRQDLFQRIKELVVELPPLRDRKEDLWPLCRAFLTREGRADWKVDHAFMAALIEHPFPGNVRELGGLLRGALALSAGQTGDRRVLNAEHLPSELKQRMRGYGTAAYGATAASGERTTAEPAVPTPTPAEPARKQPAGGSAPNDYPPKEVLVWMLRHHDNNISAVARAFNRSRGWVERAMAFHGVRIER